MKAYLGIKYYADNSNRPHIEAISEALNSSGFQCICVIRDVEAWGAHLFSPAELMARTFKIIRECDIAIIELSEKGVGLGIEAGYAFAQNKPIYTIARIGSDISTTLTGISTEVLLYQGADDLVKFFTHLKTNP